MVGPVSDSSTVELQVVDAEAGGWIVRRSGEAQALSYHDTREQAEKAARLHSTEAVGVDLRQDIFTNDPESAVRPRHTFALAAGALVAVAALVVVLALLLA